MPAVVIFMIFIIGIFLCICGASEIQKKNKKGILCFVPALVLGTWFFLSVFQDLRIDREIYAEITTVKLQGGESFQMATYHDGALIRTMNVTQQTNLILPETYKVKIVYWQDGYYGLYYYKSPTISYVRKDN